MNAQSEGWEKHLASGNVPLVDVRASVIGEVRARRASPEVSRTVVVFDVALWVMLIGGAAVLGAMAYDHISDPFGLAIAAITGEAL